MTQVIRSRLGREHAHAHCTTRRFCVHLYSVSATTPSLWPREHGAGIQLAFPVVSACVLAHCATASLALALAAVLSFLAHEPLLLLSGGRGARKRALVRTPALVRLLLLGGLALIALLVTWLYAPSEAYLPMLASALLGIFAFGLALARRERNVVAEVFVAVTLSTLALPVAVAGGVTVLAGASLAATWAVGLATATVAARALVVQKSDSGRGLRIALVVASAIAVALLIAGATGTVPIRLAMAPLPLVAVALVLALFPPPPKRMTAVGLGMSVACVGTLVVVLSALSAN